MFGAHQTKFSGGDKPDKKKSVSPSNESQLTIEQKLDSKLLFMMTGKKRGSMVPIPPASPKRSLSP